MALIYIDGFDSYVLADLFKRWSDTGGTGTSPFTIQSTLGRNGTGCLRMATATGGLVKALSRSLGGSKASFAFGVAVRFGSLGTFGGGQFLTLSDTSNSHIVLRLTGVGDLAFYSGTTLITSIAANIIPSVWYYIEMKATISNSVAASSCVIRINGVTVYTAPAGTNIRQGGGSNNSVSQLALCADNQWVSSAQTDYDDFYLFDQTGTTNNGNIGDIRVESIRPTGTGNASQWTPNGAVNNWDCVDEAAEDGDSTYVSTGTVSQADTYAIGDLSNTPTTVYGLQVAITARKDDAGSRIITGAIRSGGTTYDHASTNSLGVSDNYTTLLDPWDLDPNGGIAWTGASINAIEAGIKLIG